MDGELCQGCEAHSSSSEISLDPTVRVALGTDACGVLEMEFLEPLSLRLTQVPPSLSLIIVEPDLRVGNE